MNTLSFDKVLAGSEVIFYDRMKNFVSELKGKRVVTRPFDPKALGPAVSKNAPDQRSIKVFESIQESTFGLNSIQLLACESCGFMADPASPVVFVENRKILNIFESKVFSRPDLIMAFILAHEVSHFIYEASVQTTGKSFNGNASMLTHPLVEFAYWLSGRPLDLISAHAEVDIYALIILKDLGYEKPIEVLKLVESFSREQRSVRIPVIKAAISFLWNNT